MKKTIFLMTFCAMSIALSAQTITASCEIVMKALQSKTSDIFNIFEIAEAHANKFDNEWDGTKIINSNLPSSINIYTTTSYGRLAIVALPDIKGMPITIQTNPTETNYSFTFTDVEGDVKVHDLLLDSVITVVKGKEYLFTAEVDSIITDRFRIYKPFTPDEGEWYGCFMEDNKLYIYNNPYSANIVITDVTGAQVKSIIPKATPQTIDLSTLAAGNYTLNLGNGQKELVINVK